MQARLTDSGGVPLVGAINLTVSLYDQSSGGNLLWSEALSPVALDGVVDLSLGALTPLTPSLFEAGAGGERWLGLQVGGDLEMTPRLRITSVPYAQLAAHAGSADDVPGADITPNSVMVNGVLVIDSSGTYVGPGGIVGPTGPVGPAGAAGPQGAVGATGQAGTQGVAGATGAAGPQGAAGPTGAAGPNGAQGGQGVAGAAGAQGTAGPTGAAGPQGAGGATGPAGALGPAGPTGAAGSQGAAGAAGPAGAQGPAGPTGAQGSQGSAGDTGVAGPQGAVGATGPAGAQGTAGPAGAAGPQGAGGATGPAGSVGPAGPTGAAGSQGAAGAAGPAGAQGPAGPTGAQGTMGSAGATGSQGPQGPNVLDSGTTITGSISFPSNVNVTSGTLSTDDIVSADTGSASTGVIDATASSSTGVGVLGRGDVGVLGIATTLTGNAVEGEGPAFGNGVFGRNSNANGTALLGIAEGASGPTFALNGQNTSPSGRGVYGFAAFASGTTYGVRGDVLSPGGFGVFSTGDFGGTGAKYFIAPDPSNPAREVRFIALEGNEAGTYFRGSAEIVAGQAIIQVPEDFRLVTEQDGLTVHLTSTGAWAPLWVETKGLNQIVIKSEADHLSFDYVVNGFRRGYVDTPTIAENEHYRPLYRDLPFGTQYPEGVQQILIESGILNADLTPNEATAASLGWELRDASEAPHIRYSSREE